MPVESIKRDQLSKIAFVVWVVFIGVMCYLCSLCFGGMLFHSNDDASIQDTLSGRYTGSPFPIHQYISVFLSYPVYWLYKLFPGIEWWYFISQSVMLLAMLLINVVIGLEAENNRFPLALTCIFVGVIDFTYLSYPISNTAYTIVAAFAGTASMLLLMSNEKGKPVCFVISCVLFFISLFFRYQSGIVLLCFLILGLLYYLIHRFDFNIPKRALAFVLILFISGSLVLSFREIDLFIQSKVNGNNYFPLVSARGEYKDYPHDSYESNLQIYQDVGWSYETYWLANAWCFWDPAVNSDSFRYLIDNSQVRHTRNLETIVTRWNRFSDKDDRIFAAVSIWLVLSGITFVSIVMSANWKSAILFLINVFGTVVLVIYQLYSGRIIYRSFIICIIPSVCFNSFLFMKQYTKAKSHKMLCVISACALLFCLFPLKGLLFGSYGFSAQKKLEEKYNNLEIAQAEYVKNHPENIYIKHTYTTIDVSPWAERPVNLMDWGKPDYGSFAQRAKLHANGIESLCGDVMKKSNVFFLSETDFSLYVGEKMPTNDRTTHLYNYLSENYGATGIRLVDKVCDNIFVYQFVFDNSEEKLYDIQDYVVRRKNFF